MNDLKSALDLAEVIIFSRDLEHAIATAALLAFQPNKSLVSLGSNSSPDDGLSRYLDYERSRNRFIGRRVLLVGFGKLDRDAAVRLYSTIRKYGASVTGVWDWVDSESEQSASSMWHTVLGGSSEGEGVLLSVLPQHTLRAGVMKRDCSDIRDLTAVALEELKAPSLSVALCRATFDEGDAPLGLLFTMPGASADIAVVKWARSLAEGCCTDEDRLTLALWKGVSDAKTDQCERFTLIELPPSDVRPADIFSLRGSPLLAQWLMLVKCPAAIVTSFPESAEIFCPGNDATSVFLTKSGLFEPARCWVYVTLVGRTSELWQALSKAEGFEILKTREQRSGVIDLAVPAGPAKDFLNRLCRVVAEADLG